MRKRDGLEARRLRWSQSRGVSELVALLILLGALTAVFVSLTSILPRYLQSYWRMSVEAGFSEGIGSLETDAFLTRVPCYGNTCFILSIFNNADTPTTVKYWVVCSSIVITKNEDGIKVMPGDAHVKVIQVSTASVSDSVCYLVVEEGNSLIYKVLES
ncbi:MAG: hypothetical protein QW290_02640 [Sulfolobales archaeon]